MFLLVGYSGYIAVMWFVPTAPYKCNYINQYYCVLQLRVVESLRFKIHFCVPFAV